VAGVGGGQSLLTMTVLAWYGAVVIFGDHPEVPLSLLVWLMVLDEGGTDEAADGSISWYLQANH
jgi:hypothetical protein